MDWNRVEGNWKQVKGKIKEQWGNLTDDDLDAIEGRHDQLEGKIQLRCQFLFSGHPHSARTRPLVPQRLQRLLRRAEACPGWLHRWPARRSSSAFHLQLICILGEIARS